MTLAQVIRPDLEGQKVQHIGGQAPRYIVMDGILRHIPDPTTETKLFVAKGPSLLDLSGVAGFNQNDPNSPLYPLVFPQEGPDISGNDRLLPTALIQGYDFKEVYLIDYKDIVNGDRTLVRRWIFDITTFNNFDFNANSIYFIDDIIIYAIPIGEGIAIPNRYQGVVFPRP
jgi:hypothetical protein